MRPIAIVLASVSILEVNRPRWAVPVPLIIGTIEHEDARTRAGQGQHLVKRCRHRFVSIPVLSDATVRGERRHTIDMFLLGPIPRGPYDVGRQLVTVDGSEQPFLRFEDPSKTSSSGGAHVHEHANLSRVRLEGGLQGLGVCVERGETWGLRPAEGG